MKDETKKCPMCAEQIPLAATVCEYCGTRFDVSVNDGLVESRSVEEPVKQPIPTTISSGPAAKQGIPWGWIAGGLGLLLILALVGGGIMLAQNGLPFLATPTNTPLPAPAMEVSVYCGYFGDSPVYLNAGQPVILSWIWGAASDGYRQDYIDSASFALQLDGKFQDLSQVTQSLVSCKYGDFCVTWRLPAISLAKGRHEVIMTVSIAREITDGFDLDQNGALDTYGPEDWTAPPCEIIVQ